MYPSINICSLQPLSGLSLAHTVVYSNVTCLIFFNFSFYYSVIYALFSWAFGIAPYGMPSIMEGALQLFLCQATVTHCVISIVEGEPPPPRSTPWGAYRPTISCEAVPLHSALVGSTRAHSLTVDRSTVVGHILMDHMCSFMCTSHIDMTVHNPAFLRVR